MSTSISISKLKSELRQAQRLLSRNDKLNASLRVETERRVESLKSQIHEEQQRRGEQETNGTTTAAPALAPPAQDQDASKQNGTESAGETTKPKSKNKKSAKEDKYKMLRHVEFQKSSRRLKQAERELAAINAKLGALPTDDSKTTRKERKALEKEKTAAESKRDHALIDAWYGVTLPSHFKYVALYPAGSYVEFGDLPTLPDVPASSTAEAALESYTAGTPPARKPDEVRSYWRAVVKARLARGDIQGNPQKSKATSSAPQKSRKSIGRNGKAGQTKATEHRTSESKLDEDDADDFFE